MGEADRCRSSPGRYNMMNAEKIFQKVWTRAFQLPGPCAFRLLGPCALSSTINRIIVDSSNCLHSIEVFKLVNSPENTYFVACAQNFENCVWQLALFAVPGSTQDRPQCYRALRCWTDVLQLWLESDNMHLQSASIAPGALGKQPMTPFVVQSRKVT